VAVADQEWLVQWLPQVTPPAGRNHGSSAVCFTRNGVVLVSRHRERWEFPAGRPEADESLLDTLCREVREEACCEVGTANLLGFTVSTCLEGHERDVALVRAHWAAWVTPMPWRPVHEIVERVVGPTGRRHVDAHNGGRSRTGLYGDLGARSPSTRSLRLIAHSCRRRGGARPCR
jgi:8-oxo-dGTP pyrophosphatase MutT (NUDIX family)